MTQWEQLRFLATDRGVTVGCAESLTGGLLGGYITRASGSSAYFKGTLCAYDIHSKVEILGVDGHHAAEVNCVSPQVAREMALGACSLFGSTYGVSTTGYADNSPEGYPYAYWCIVKDGEMVAEGRVGAPFQWADRKREEVQKMVAHTVLSNLVRVLRS